MKVILYYSIDNETCFRSNIEENKTDLTEAEGLMGEGTLWVALREVSQVCLVELRLDLSDSNP